MKYRKASVDEAEQFWNLMNQLDYETKYMLYEPGERTKNLPQIESLIRDSVEGEDFLLVAETDHKLIGYISAQKGRLNRIAHSAYIVVGILREYRGSCDWLCKMIDAEISRLRMVAISFSNLGICPIFANSSSKHRTWTGSRPPYSSSALSHKRLNSCV